MKPLLSSSYPDLYSRRLLLQGRPFETGSHPQHPFFRREAKMNPLLSQQNFRSNWKQVRKLCCGSASCYFRRCLFFLCWIVAITVNPLRPLGLPADRNNVEMKSWYQNMSIVARSLFSLSSCLSFQFNYLLAIFSLNFSPLLILVFIPFTHFLVSINFLLFFFF